MTTVEWIIDCSMEQILVKMKIICEIVISRSVQGRKYAVFNSRSHLGDAHTEALVDNWELY